MGNQTRSAMYIDSALAIKRTKDDVKAFGPERERRERGSEKQWKVVKLSDVRISSTSQGYYS